MTLVERLRKRAEIRRSIPRGEPDRISDILEEAATTLEEQEKELLILRELKRAHENYEL